VGYAKRYPSHGRRIALRDWEVSSNRLDKCCASFETAAARPPHDAECWLTPSKTCVIVRKAAAQPWLVSNDAQRRDILARSLRLFRRTSFEGSAMKISFDIDCTPEELRGFFGLPDVRAMQEQLLKDVEERMRANVKALDPETMVKTWLPAGLKGFEQLQEMFLNQMAAAAAAGAGKK
jgi:Family of unknown function (DUF6489)